MMQLTEKQQEQICYLIGDWYINVKDNLDIENKTHRLGFAKEVLKEMICNNKTFLVTIWEMNNKFLNKNNEKD
jgi:hypothetical protein